MPESRHNHPLPMSVVLNFKFDSNGKIAKRKVRMTIAGHPGAVTKGIHYQETYSATPVRHTNRLLQAIMVLNRWKRLTLDVRQAFLNADLEEGRKFAVRYPSGLRHWGFTPGFTFCCTFAIFGDLCCLQT